MSSLKGKTLEEIHGKERALEIRKKISESHKGKITPKEVVQKIIESRKGFHHTIESREKIRTAALNQTRSPHSQQAKDKISKANLGKKHTEETKKKIGLVKKGRKHTEEHKKKIGEGMKLAYKDNPKKPHSETTKEKIRQARLKQVLPVKDTSIEIKLQQALEKEGFGFQKHKPILGQPDIFIEPNLCIFADGDYWHNYPLGRSKDIVITNSLVKQGYVVLRFWEREINNNIEQCISMIKNYIKEDE